MIGENGTFKNKISDEEMSLLPVNSFPGVIHLIERTEQVNAAIDYLSIQPCLGFDT